MGQTLLSVPLHFQYAFKPYDPNAGTTRIRRHLPHWFQAECTCYVTFRLAGSLPQERHNHWLKERDLWLGQHPEPRSEDDWEHYHKHFTERMESWIDAGYGECHLANPRVRRLVEECLTHFDAIRYALGDYVVMPNHVHVLITPIDGHGLSGVLKGIKGVSARKCNQVLSRRGTFWMDESFDHLVRSLAQLETYRQYIAENPRRAGLRPGCYSLRLSETVWR